MPYATTLTYRQAQRLAIGVAVVIVAALAAVMYARRVETAEVVAVLLFFPVFVCALRWNIAGGVVAAVGASVIYVAVRWSAINVVGFGTFAGLVSSRVLGLVVFGLAGGWANGELRGSLTKLDLYDQIDDATGLFNARSFVHQTGLESARAARYHTFFSVVTVAIPMDRLGSSGRRNERRLLRDLGRVLRDSIRTVDTAIHARIGDQHTFAIVLPETAADGAQVFGDRLAAQLTRWLSDRGVTVGAPLRADVVVVPGDEDAMAELTARFVSADLLDHPPVATPDQS